MLCTVIINKTESAIAPHSEGQKGQCFGSVFETVSNMEFPQRANLFLQSNSIYTTCLVITVIDSKIHKP